jgi:hypothetical protein
MIMHKGSCLCGAVAYELISEPKAVTHCHFKMCQKQHGAAFATFDTPFNPKNIKTIHEESKACWLEI